MTHDAGHWDERYATQQPAGDPDLAVVRAVESLAPGRALDLATGLGRHARWLADRGWAVTAVDFSAVGIARAQELETRADPNEATARQIRRRVASLREEPAEPITWLVADVRTWAPEPGTPPYDLVLCAFLHLDLARIRGWLAPGGHLVVVSHAPGADDAPRNPAYRYDEQQLRAAAHGLTIEQLADDPASGRITLVARRPQPG